MTMNAMKIQLQTSVGDFDDSFVKELMRFEGVMLAKGLDPSAYIISKDRVQFTSLPFFVRPGGDGFNYTVFVDGESFSVTKANDLAFLGYFEQLCAAAIADEKQELPTLESFWTRLAASFGRIERWFNTPMFKKPE